MTKYFTDEERREAKRKKSRRQRERRAEREGRVLREYAQYHKDGLAKERKVMGKRYARALKAMEEGRAFRPRLLCDAHVKAYVRHMDKIQRAAAYIGPPKPSEKLLGKAGYRKWCYWNIPGQREKEIKKRNKYVKEASPAYVKERLRVSNAPAILLEAKRYQLLIAQLIKDKQT